MFPCASTVDNNSNNGLIGTVEKSNLFHAGKVLCLPDVTAALQGWRDLPSQGRTELNWPLGEIEWKEFIFSFPNSIFFATGWNPTRRVVCCCFRRVWGFRRVRSLHVTLQSLTVTFMRWQIAIPFRYLPHSKVLLFDFPFLTLIHEDKTNSMITEVLGFSAELQKIQLLLSLDENSTTTK